MRGLNVYTSTKGQVPSVDARDAIRQVIVNGVPRWLDVARGRTFPQVAGAEDPPPADPNTENQNDDDGDEFDKDRALATIRKQRERERAQAAELKTVRAEAEALKAKEQARADADKSELEKAQARLAEREKAHAESEAKLRRLTISQAIERAARKHNARNPEVVAKLIDAEALTFDDSGEPTNAEDLVKELLKKETYLVGSATSGTGVPPSPRANGQPQGHDDRVKENREKLRASGGYEPL